MEIYKFSVSGTVPNNGFCGRGSTTPTLEYWNEQFIGVASATEVYSAPSGSLNLGITEISNKKVRRLLASRSKGIRLWHLPTRKRSLAP